MDKTQAALHRLMERARAQVDAITDRLLTGATDPDGFTAELFDTLTEHHARAAYLGRYRAGDTSPPEEDDRRFADLVMRGEDPYLARFATDLETGRYRDDDGEWRGDAVRRRAGMYLGHVAGTANEAFALSSPGPIYWRLGGEEGSCGDCPRIAAYGPYTAETLPTYPRANETGCLFHCRCYLERGDGLKSFRS